MLSYTNQKEQKLIKSIKLQYPHISPLIINKLLSKKDIKVNNKRVKENCDLKCGDEIEIYIADNYAAPKIDVIYEDNNILVVNKPVKIEVVSNDNNKVTLTTILNKTIKVYPVHRLDTNTSGLIIYAKSKDILNHFIMAFENNYINKYYQAIAYSKATLSSQQFTDYMAKDIADAKVRVFRENSPNLLPAKLNFNIISKKDNLYLLNIELLTGRTHQIRAQLASHKIFIIGDGKYGDKEINRIYKKRYQQLCAYKIVFHFPENSNLSYLNNENFEIKPPFVF